MSKIMRCKFKKEGDMIYISHLDIQRLLQRAFRRAEIRLSHSQGYNPHPKMSYANALALGVESQGEYVDIEIEDDITEDEFKNRINNTLPEGIEFTRVYKIEPKTKSLASNIKYGEYLFTIDLDKPLTKGFIKNKLLEFMNKKEILVVKKNKKGVEKEIDIRPFIRSFDVLSFAENILTFNAVIATGSLQNLNINIFLPIILTEFEIDIDYREIDVIRRGLFYEEDGRLVTPMNEYM